MISSVHPSLSAQSDKASHSSAISDTDIADLASWLSAQCELVPPFRGREGESVRGERARPMDLHTYWHLHGPGVRTAWLALLAKFRALASHFGVASSALDLAIERLSAQLLEELARPTHQWSEDTVLLVGLGRNELSAFMRVLASSRAATSSKQAVLASLVQSLLARAAGAEGVAVIRAATQATSALRSLAGGMADAMERARCRLMVDHCRQVLVESAEPVPDDLPEVRRVALEADGARQRSAMLGQFCDVFGLPLPADASVQRSVPVDVEGFTRLCFDVGQELSTPMRVAEVAAQLLASVVASVELDEGKPWCDVEPGSPALHTALLAVSDVWGTLPPHAFSTLVGSPPRERLHKDHNPLAAHLWDRLRAAGMGHSELPLAIRRFQHSRWGPCAWVDGAGRIDCLRVLDRDEIQYRPLDVESLRTFTHTLIASPRQRKACVAAVDAVEPGASARLGPIWFITSHSMDRPEGTIIDLHAPAPPGVGWLLGRVARRAVELGTPRTIHDVMKEALVGLRDNTLETALLSRDGYGLAAVSTLLHRLDHRGVGSDLAVQREVLSTFFRRCGAGMSLTACVVRAVRELELGMGGWAPLMRRSADQLGTAALRRHVGEQAPHDLESAARPLWCAGYEQALQRVLGLGGGDTRDGGSAGFDLSPDAVERCAAVVSEATRPAPVAQAMAATILNELEWIAQRAFKRSWHGMDGRLARDTPAIRDCLRKYEQLSAVDLNLGAMLIRADPTSNERTLTHANPNLLAFQILLDMQDQLLLQKAPVYGVVLTWPTGSGDEEGRLVHIDGDIVLQQIREAGEVQSNSVVGADVLWHLEEAMQRDPSIRLTDKVCQQLCASAALMDPDAPLPTLTGTLRAADGADGRQPDERRSAAVSSGHTVVERPEQPYGVA